MDGVRRKLIWTRFDWNGKIPLMLVRDEAMDYSQNYDIIRSLQ